MCPQISSLSKWFVAIGATVLLLSTVSQLMCLQIASLGEWFVALFTFVSLFFCVDEQVPLQISSLTKWFIALGTFVLLLSSVSDQMLGQFAWICKWLEAHDARMFVGHLQNINCSPQLVDNNWGGNDPHSETHVHFPFPNVNQLWSIFFWNNLTKYRTFTYFENLGKINQIHLCNRAIFEERVPHCALVVVTLW